VKILLGNIDSQIEGVDSRTARALCDWLAVRAPRYWFDPRYQKCWCGLKEVEHRCVTDHGFTRQWDGNIRFFSDRTYRLPTGLMPVLCARLDAERIGYEVVDVRTNRPAFNPEGRIAGKELRSFQGEALAALLAERLGPHWFPSGICSLPTASGKTALVAGVCAIFTGRALILVHRKTLMRQTARELSTMLSEDVGVIGDGLFEPRRVTVATVQTLAPYVKEATKASRELLDVSTFISDEAHHLGQAKKTFLAIARKCPAFVRLAVSATPFKRDDLVQAYRLHGATGRVIYSKTPGEIQALGYLPHVCVNFIPITQPTEVTYAEQLTDPDGPGAPRTVPMWTLPYRADETGAPGAYDAGIVGNAYRNDVVVRRARAAIADGKITLVLCVRETHGIALAEALGCPFIYGKTHTEKRDALLKQLGAGTLRCLVASTILDEGIDVPAISHLVLAGAGKDDGVMLQRIGRGARLKEDGGGLTVDDFLDNHNESLWKQSAQRYLACKRAGYETALLEVEGIAA
jgi:superfamily II DNA or RNA helicase